MAGASFSEYNAELLGFAILAACVGAIVSSVTLRELKDWTSFRAPFSEEESGAGLKGQAEKDRRWTISGASRTRSRA
jgi:hypothetical protein